LRELIRRDAIQGGANAAELRRLSMKYRTGKHKVAGRLSNPAINAAKLDEAVGGGEAVADVRVEIPA